MDQNQQSHGIDGIFNESSQRIKNLHYALSKLFRLCYISSKLKDTFIILRTTNYY